MTLAPYLQLGRFDRPIGITLLVIPCWWGQALVQGAAIDLSLMLLFLAGAMVMRGAGCTLNDILDQTFDRQVERTKNRPLATGALSVTQALSFFAVLTILGAIVLWQLPWRCWGLGVAAFGLLAIYPLMKRLMPWPQFILGLAFNSGVIIGAAAVVPLQDLPWLPVLMSYFAGTLITVAYDTIYACQDRTCDQKLGLHSTALSFGAYVRGAVITCYAVACSALMMALFAVGTNLVALMVLLGSHGVFIWMASRLDLNNHGACQQFFLRNQWLLFLIFLAILLS